MFSDAHRPMSAFALLISEAKPQISTILEVEGKKALRLSQKQVEYFIKGCNIFPHRSERYFIFESENTGEDVEGLDNVVFWKEPTIPVKPIGTTEDGEIKLFSLPKASL